MKRQVRVFEIGISQRMAHNMARYTVGQSDAYSVFRFMVLSSRVMKELGVHVSQRRSIMQDAVDFMREDVLALVQGIDLSHDGGSACTPLALLATPIVQMLSCMESVSKGA